LLSAYSSIFVNSLFKFTVGMNINILNSYWPLIWLKLNWNIYINGVKKEQIIE
jgi:hypothetical protein